MDAYSLAADSRPTEVETPGLTASKSAAYIVSRQRPANHRGSKTPCPEERNPDAQ